MSIRSILTAVRFPRHHLIPALTLTAVWAVFLCPGAGAADAPDPNAAKRSDAEIQKFVGQLEAKLNKNPGLKKGPAAVLYRYFEFDTTQKSHLALRSFVMLVNDPGSDLAQTRTLNYQKNAEIEYRGGWIWRDGKVVRLEDSNWATNTTGGESPQDVTVSFPGLKKGDLVCYAVEATLPYPFNNAPLRLSGDLPVMISNTRVRTDGLVSLEFLGHNLVKKKHAKKVYEEKDGFPIDTKFTVVDIPADRTGDDAPRSMSINPIC